MIWWKKKVPILIKGNHNRFKQIFKWRACSIHIAQIVWTSYIINLESPIFIQHSKFLIWQMNKTRRRINDNILVFKSIDLYTSITKFLQFDYPSFFRFYRPPMYTISIAFSLLNVVWIITTKHDFWGWVTNINWIHT